MKIDEDHVGPGDEPLGRDVKDVQNAVRRPIAPPDGVGRIDADRHPRETLDDRHVGEIDQVAVRIAQVDLDAPKAEDDVPISLARHVLARVERFLQGNPHAALVENREFPLLTHDLQELEVLGVSGPDLEHHARGVPRGAESRTDLVDMVLVRDLHRDDADAVLPGQLEHVRKAFLPEPLEVVRARPRLVGAHPRRHEASPLAGLHHLLHVLLRVDGAQPGEDVASTLVERNTVVCEPDRIHLPFVPSDDPVFLRDADDPLDARHFLEDLLGHAGGPADQVDFDEGPRLAADLVDPGLDAGILFRLPENLLDFGSVRIDIRSENDNHFV